MDISAFNVIMDDMLTIRNLTKIYKQGEVETIALDDVSFKVKKGQMVALMGKSGSGKSTLLRQLSLIDKPNSGKIIINGREVIGTSEKIRSKLRLETLGYVFQEYALLPELTALENVYLPAMMLGKRGVDYKQRAKELLDIVDLSDRVKHLPKELSGGEQQRVAIARAMVNSPKVIFADEPTANLDTASAKVVMETIRRLNKKTGVTVIFVSHNPDDKQYADELIFLRDGRIVEEY